MAPKPAFELPESRTGRDPLTREALAWLVYLHSGDETAKDWEDFQLWKATDEEHQKAAEVAEALWQRLGPALLKHGKTRNKLIPAALVAAVMLGAIAFADGWFGPPAAFFAEHQTGTGQIRHISLRDGSEVDIDTGTSFDVDATGRTITLYEGKVLVSVKPNPGAAFKIVAGTTTIQALGTEFSVSLESGSGDVVVTEHAVEVSQVSRDRSVAVRVPAGEMVAYTSQGLGQPRKADIEALTAWRKGELIADGLPLGAIAREINRYYSGRIVILDDDIRALPVSGSFDLADIDAFFEAIKLTLPVSIFRVPGLIVIRSNRSASLQ